MTRVTILELPARWAQARAQLALARDLARAAPTDLLVLPEAALTGYVSPALTFDLRPFARPEHRALAPLRSLARATGADVLGPVISLERGNAYNGVAGVAPDGEVWLRYRKRHPWMPERWATPGEDPPPVVERFGLTLTCAICFDIHFLADDAAPQLARSDVLLFPSAWVEEVDSRPTLLSALRDTFHLTVVNANWGPGVPRIPGQGGSRVEHRDGAATVMPTGQLRLDVEL